MTSTLNRRGFLRSAGSALAVAGVASRCGWASAHAAAQTQLSTPSAAQLGWRLAVATYTFRGISFYEMLDKVSALGVKYVEPAFFLKLDKDRPELQTGDSLSAPLRAEMRQRMKDHGISMPNYYADVKDDADAARKAFEFAKEMGVETIVAEPPASAFDMVERLCDEYKINLAVHNHPKGPDSRYWDPANVLAVCQGRGPRIGACCDTGHWVRSALPVLPMIQKMEGRIITMHLKDVAEEGRPEARDVPLGEGRADYAAVLRELHRQKFAGVLSIEYEHESDQLVDDVAQCLAFVEKTSRSILEQS